MNDIIFTEKTLITDKFPVQSAFSILPEKEFAMNDIRLINYEDIKNFQKQLIYEDIDESLKLLINEFFETKQDLGKDDKNEFYLFGHFDELIEINNSFCIWFDNKDFSLYYKENNIYIKIGKKYSNKLSDKNFSLICSKYSIEKRNSTI